MVTRAKLSVKASPTGLKRVAEKRRMSGSTAEVIGALAGVSRSSAQKFLNGQPISAENFQALCLVLELDWEEIIESEEIASSVIDLKRVAFPIEGSLDGCDLTQLAEKEMEDGAAKNTQQIFGGQGLQVNEKQDQSIIQIQGNPTLHFDKSPSPTLQFGKSPSEARKIQIFLASSEELRDDRDKFETYFRQLNDALFDKGFYLVINRWENFLDAMSETRLQDEYNKSVKGCDIFVSLFFTKTGKFTEEE